MNVNRRDESVATDTIYYHTSATNYGSTCTKLFVGTKSLVYDVYLTKTDKMFVNTLECNICAQGAMSKLISDFSQS